ncbi:Uncharacterised protein [Gemella morbillorum]|uniref:hypothetical protein n=1 Tax=Gemella morbillorum TaxID=29391 RepID=UPI000DA3BD0C|nr:hypothetical protein [Gemella morbillorum]UBH81400.1 hypothetical protein LA320_03640 [Gemella morbillorum]SQH55170.1 Uncharacterised protein [Gemella morbillorum]
MNDISLNYSLVLTEGKINIDTSFVGDGEITRIIIEQSKDVIAQLQLLPKEVILYFEQHKDRIILKSNKELIQKEDKVYINF